MLASSIPSNDPSENSLDPLLYPTRRNLRDAWTEDADFFAKFFPVDSYSLETFSSSRKGLYGRKRWTGIPSKPASVSRLYTPLNNLINNLLDKFNLLDDHQGNRRLSLKTSKGVEPELENRIQPSLLLSGSGKHFLASTAPCPEKHYGSGVAPIAIRLESEDETFSRDCLCAVVQELFAYQHNRRYVFGVVMSQLTVVVHMFDHSGATSSPPLDYHSEPEQFCAIISGLASHDAERVGFDTSFFKDGTRWGLRTREVVGRTRRSREVKYSVVSTLYYMANIVGRGTICFAAFREGERKPCVIKDSWASVDELEGKESEASLLAHAQSCGISKGIPLIHHSEEVQVKGEAGRMRPDTIFNNRHAPLVANSKYERLHTRLILTPYGTPLDKFTNRRELLFAYHDALEAHRKLYTMAGILHRDIKPGNILIHADGEEGNRGILIDYDHAIRISDTSPYSTKRKIGTYLFMSYKALDGNEPQTYMDDLESFYYVLVYLVRLHAEKLTYDLPYPLDHWSRPTASLAKNGFFLSKFDYATDPRLGKPFQTLVERLHSVFRNIVIQVALTDDGAEPPVVNPEEIYDMMLAHVREAINDLNRDAEDGITTPCNSICGQGQGKADTSEGGSLFPVKRRKISANKKVVRTLAASRTRRNRSNFRLRT